jgi:hypothetical protein
LAKEHGVQALACRSPWIVLCSEVNNLKVELHALLQKVEQSSFTSRQQLYGDVPEIAGKMGKEVSEDRSMGVKTQPLSDAWSFAKM